MPRTLKHNVNKEIAENTYGTIRSINVISTSDMINFTDHGSIRVADPTGAAKWAHNSWAPAAWKEIDGKVKFFLSKNAAPATWPSAASIPVISFW